MAKSDQIGLVHSAVEAAGVPIFGLRYVEEQDTFEVDFQPEATQAQRAVAANVIAGFNHVKAEKKQKRQNKRKTADVLDEILLFIDTGVKSQALLEMIQELKED